MKKGFLKVLTAGAILATSVGLVACDTPNDTKPKYTIEDYDKTYTINESFSLEGAKLKIKTEAGTTEEITITNDMIKSMPDMTTPGNKTIIIVYNGVEYSLSITVLPTVESYSFTGYAQEYFINDEFNITNLKLNLTFSDESVSQVAVTSNMIQNMPDMTTAGNKTVVIVYEGAEYSFSFTVSVPTVESYSFTGYEQKYDINSEFDITNLKLNLTLSDDSVNQVAVTSNMIQSMPDMTTAGTKTVVIVYEGVEYSLSFTVLAPTVEDYSFTGYAQEYYTNSEFDITNLKLNITFSDETISQISVTSNMIQSMPDMTTPGTKTVVIVYEGLEYSLSFTVLAPTVVDYSFTGYAQEYYTNSEFDITNLKLNLALSNETIEQVAVTANMIQNMPNMTTAGTKTVIVVYEGGQYSLSFTVSVPTVESYSFTGYEQQYDINSEFDITNLKLNLALSNETIDQVSVTSNMIQNMPDMTTEGVKTVEVTYNGDVYSFSFRVADVKKEAMIAKLQQFLTDYNSNSIKASSLNIETQGNAKYLKDTVDFNQHIINIATSSFQNLDGYKIYQPASKEFYVFVKEFANIDELNSFYDSIALPGLNYIVEYKVDDTTYITYGPLKTIPKEDELTQISTDEFKKFLVTKFISGEDGEFTCLFDPMLAKPIYNSIINGIVNSTINIQKGDILSANNQLTAKLDILDTLKNISTNMANVDFYDYFVNDILFTESESYYINPLVNELVRSLSITNQDSIDDLKYTLGQYLKAIKNKEWLTDLSTTYNTIIEVNDIIQNSDADKALAEKINIIISGIDNQDKHMLSKLVYSFRNFAEVRQLVQGEEVPVDASDLIDAYYGGLQSLVERFENITDYTNVKTFANDIITDLRAIDAVNQEFVANNYVGTLINFNITSLARVGVEYYIEMYDAEMIADFIDMLAQQYLPDNSEMYNTNVIETLQNCADTIYQAFKPTTGNIDYIKLVEDLCEILNVEKDYYIEQFNNGNVTICTDFFDRHVKCEATEGVQFEMYTAYRNACMYLDSIFVQGTDRTEFMNEINKCATAMYNLYSETQTDPELVMLFDCLAKLTNTEQDFYTNLRGIVKDYKSTAKEYIKMALIPTLGIDSANTIAMEDLDYIIDYHLQAYIKDEFDISLLVSDLNDYIDRNCNEDVKIYSNTATILTALLMGQQEEIDYNELFANIKLPNEIKDIDFNKLIKQTLKDKNTYDILSLNDVKVDYITDNDGNIIKELLTVSLNANYDIMISSLDADVTLTIEINF